MYGFSVLRALIAYAAVCRASRISTGGDVGKLDPEPWQVVHDFDEAETVSLRRVVHTEEECSTCSQGDIQLPPGSDAASFLEANSNNTLGTYGGLWPNGVVWFRWKDAIHPKAKAVTLTAMNIWERKTCIKFKEVTCTDGHKGCADWAKSGECTANPGYMLKECQMSCQQCSGFPHPVNIGSDKEGCNAHVGYYSEAWQDMNLAEGCHHVGTVLHELGHVIGLAHEQERGDRNTYVDVRMANVEEAMRRNFVLKPWRKGAAQKLPYDLSSIMHYEPWAFARAPNYLDESTKTIVVKSSDSYGNCKIGQRSELSIGDQLTVATMYGCSNSRAHWSDRSKWRDSSCRDTQYRGESCAGIGNKVHGDGAPYCAFMEAQVACPRSCGACPAEVFC